MQAEGVRLERLSAESLREALASGRSGPSGRPVAQLSFAANHFFSGFDPYAFKVTNLVIHAFCCLLIFSLTLRLMAELSRTKEPEPSADPALGKLTRREKEVLVELAAGKSNLEIARQLFISENTVKYHVHSLAR